MKDYRVIAFDLDGTLADPAEGLLPTFAYALSKMGVDYGTRDSLRRYIGPPLVSAWREDFAALLWSVAGDLPVLNPDPAIPDVPGERYDYQQTAAIRWLYQAGILNGTDAQGTFRGASPLNRGQAAVMLSRVLDPSLRIGASDT